MASLTAIESIAWIAEDAWTRAAPSLRAAVREIPHRGAGGLLLYTADGVTKERGGGAMAAPPSSKDAVVSVSAADGGGVGGASSSSSPSSSSYRELGTV